MGKWAWLQKLGKVMGKMAPKWAGIQNVEVGQLTLEFCPFHYLPTASVIAFATLEQSGKTQLG